MVYVDDDFSVTGHNGIWGQGICLAWMNTTYLTKNETIHKWLHRQIKGVSGDCVSNMLKNGYSTEMVYVDDV